MELCSYICNRLVRKKRSLSSFMKTVLVENLGKRIFVLMIMNIFSTLVMFYYCGSTNSMALTAYSYISIFNVLRLASCFITIWVGKQRASFAYSFGYERFEVLSVFVCTALTQLGAFFIFKESFERLIETDTVLYEAQVFVVLLGLLTNFVVTHAVENKPFDVVSRVAASNWIQDILFDTGKSICGYIPFLSRFLLVRMNPYILLSNVAAICVVVEMLFIQQSKAYEADTIAAMFIAVLICVTMYPLSAHCALILLQATPQEVSTSIDKCLKEANTLDGLLEFRQENFWTVSFGKYAGLLHVRIRRDANEQLILAQLTNKLSPYLHYVTIQIYKDDWKPSVETTTESNTLKEQTENIQYNALKSKYLKTLPVFNSQHTNLPVTNNYKASYIPSYQLNRTSYLAGEPSQHLTTVENKKAKYKGQKIDIDFG